MEYCPAFNTIYPRASIAVHHGFVRVARNQRRAFGKSREDFIVWGDSVWVIDVQKVCAAWEGSTHKRRLRNLFVLSGGHHAVVTVNCARFLPTNGDQLDAESHRTIYLPVIGSLRYRSKHITSLPGR